MNIIEKANNDQVNPVDLARRLAEVLRGILSAARWLTDWSVTPVTGGTRDPGWDIIASGPLPRGGTAKLCVECKLHFQPSQFASLSGRFCPVGVDGNNIRVLAMPNISGRMAALCEEHGWSWFDLAGNCRLEIPGLLIIDRTGRESIQIGERPAANLSTPEAGNIVRALLAPENAGKRWTQRQMVAHFNELRVPIHPPSLALVNKVVRYLRTEAFLDLLPNRGFRVGDYEGLLQAWRAAYRFDRATRLRYFTLLQGQAQHNKMSALDLRGEGHIAYAAFSAAEFQAPHVRQPRTWLYLASELEEQFKIGIEAKLVDSGENLVVLIPGDPGVFYELDTVHQGLPCTNAVQTYVDLMHTGGRGEEAAEAVLQQRLKPAWSRAKNEH